MLRILMILAGIGCPSSIERWYSEAMRHWGVSWTAKRALAVIVALTVTFVDHQAAVACSPAQPVPIPTDPAHVGLDGAPPIIRDVTVADFTRGAYDPDDTCGDIGWLWLDIDAEDDLTPVERLRYRVQDMSAEGAAFIFDEPVPWFNINWIDDGKMALDFQLRIFALDRGGNESAPFDIRVQDGGDAEGCSMSPARRGPTAPCALLLVAIGLVARRRR